MTTRAAIYARISNDPREQEAGVARQEADCRQMVEQRGWSVAGVYVDNDVTASQPMEQRPAFMRMLADAAEGQFTRIVAWRDDRLWRDPDHQRAVFRLCVDVGVGGIVTSRGEADPTSVEDRMISGMLALAAEYEAASVKLRVRRAAQARAEQGRPHGQRAFGYHTDGSVHEDEAPLVREAFRRVADGGTLLGICDEWNARGVPTRQGAGRWSTNALSYLLQNPRYLAKRVYRGEIIGPGDWEPLVDEATFDRVQRVFSSRRAGPKPRSLLGTLLVCDVCGDPGTASKTGKGRPVYRVGAPAKRGPESCGGQRMVDAEAADLVVRDMVVLRLQDGLWTVGPKGDADGLAEELEGLDRRLEEAADMFADGEVDRAGYTRIRGRLQERRAEVARELRDAAAPGLPPGVPESGREALLQAWDEADVDWRRAVVRALASEIHVTPGTGGRRGREQMLADTARRLRPQWRV